jgi:membrane dipeptidase
LVEHLGAFQARAGRRVADVDAPCGPRHRRRSRYGPRRTLRGPLTREAVTTYFIDGLECSIFDREIFEELRQGQLDCVTNTLCFWEDAGETLDAIAKWRDLARENHDLIKLAISAEDIRAAHDQHRTAVLLGCQNTSPLNDRLRYVELFADLGVRVMQLTYNNQNGLGGSCYEESDSGLSRFGRQVVREMNRVGMLIDLSHVGERTGKDAIEYSDVPVAVTHANPSSLFAHRRNKSDELVHALATNGGVIGVATYKNIGGHWCDSIDSWCELVARTVELVGIDHVGIGTDIGRKETLEYLMWMRHGRWTRDVDYGAGSAQTPGQVPPPNWFISTEQFPDIAKALQRRFSDDEVGAIMGGNWIRLYRTVFGR